MDRQAIMSRALRHGFTLRQQPGGEMGLNEYVYAFAREVFEAGRRAGAAASHCQGHARQQEAGEDSARLDFLDQNLGMFPIQMGWNVGVAPGGNVSITTVIGGQNNIRESIDFAMQSMKGAK